MGLMRGITLLRLVFIAVVVYVATLIRPIDGHVAINLGLGLALALLIVVAETRLRAVALTDLIGGLLGFLVCLWIAKTINNALFLADTAHPLLSVLAHPIL